MLAGCQTVRPNMLVTVLTVLVLHAPVGLADSPFNPVSSASLKLELQHAVHRVNLSDPSCALDIVDILDAASQQELWAIQMLDASSKVQSGLAEGNLFNLGSFEECVGVQHTRTEDGRRIRGKYCLYAVLFNVETTQDVLPALVRDFSFVKEYLGNRSTLGLPLIEALCVPQSCSSADLYEMYRASSLSENFPYIEPVFVEKFCQPAQGFARFSYLEWVTVFVLSGVVVLLISCTCYDLYLVRNESKPFHEIFVTFSLYSNLKKLTRIQHNADQLPCINGIRSISMMWIILGHRTAFGAVFPNTNYLYIIETLPKSLGSGIITGATVSVDTFFVISGVLVMYVVLLAKAKGFNFSLIHYYVHRIFRLSPALFMVVLVHMTLIRYLGSGPLWPFVYDVLERPCLENWWKTLLFVQNTENLGAICVGQTWYLAVDTQLYVLAPLLFVPIGKWPRLTLCTMVVLLLASCFTGFTIAWIDQVTGSVLSLATHFNSLYDFTVVRMNAWLAGALCGYMLFVMRGRQVNMPKPLVGCLWLLALASMLLVVFGQVYFFRTEYNRVLSSTYLGFSRAVWSVGVCWVIFACVHGYGGIVNTFLSMPLFTVLGRLTYSMYLVHVSILMIMIGSGDVNTRFSGFNAMHHVWGDLALVLTVSLIWSLTFESPLIAIGHIVIPTELKRKLTEISAENGVTVERNGNSSTHL